MAETWQKHALFGFSVVFFSVDASAVYHFILFFLRRALFLAYHNQSYVKVCLRGPE